VAHFSTWYGCACEVIGRWMNEERHPKGDSEDGYRYTNDKNGRNAPEEHCNPGIHDNQAVLKKQ